MFARPLVLLARTLAASSLMLGSTAAPANAWQPPEPVSAEHTFLAAPRLVETSSGVAFAAWNRQRGLGDGARTGVDVTVRRGGSWAPPRLVGSGSDARLLALADLDAYGGSRAMALVQRSAGDERLLAYLLARSGRVERIERLDSARGISTPQAALNPDGAGVAAWIRRPQRGSARIHAAFRRAGRAWSAPLSLSEGGAGAAGVGVRGSVAVVAWQRQGRLETRISRDGGSHWGRTLTLRRGLARQAQISIAVSDRGAIAIAWMHQRRTEGGETGPAVHEARLRPVRRGFGDVVRLARYDAIAPPGRQAVETAFAGDRAVLAWQGLQRASDSGSFDEPVFAVRSGALTRDGLDDERTISPRGTSAVLDDLAVARTEVAVAWRLPNVAGGGVLGEVGAAVGAVGDEVRWGAPEPVSPAGQLAGEAELAWGADGGLSAIWRARRVAEGAEAAYVARR